MNRKNAALLFATVLLPAFCPAPSFAGPDANVEKYCAMLHSKDDTERETAVAELAKIGAPAVPDVLAVLDHAEVYLGRMNAARVLGQIRDTRAIQPLVAALADDYAAVRQEASRALVAIGGKAAVDEILGALARGGDNFLEAAAVTLGELGDRRTLPALEKLSRHQNADVAKAASAAIQKLQPRG
ncbi:MAG TPA: HEAT repeat domain-containing protein [Opitutaceae bacterium]|nr:HEAT repeat domain-containing protein [Opitutaceae bacterium]